MTSIEQSQIVAEALVPFNTPSRIVQCPPHSNDMYSSFPDAAAAAAAAYERNTHTEEN